MKKTCSKCKQTKELKAFGKSPYRCLECERKRSKIRQYTPKRKFYDYKVSAMRKGLEFTITFEIFCNYWEKPCGYCGDKILKNIGLDRVDNSKGYLENNIMSCCRRCNFSKKAMSKNDFILMCKKITNYQLK